MQRRRLLRAAREVFGDNGVDHVSVADICGRASVSRRTFYELFTDRDDCLLATLRDAVRQLAHTVLPAYETGGSWRQRVRGALEALLLAFDEQPQLARLCVIETLKGGPGVLRYRREILDLLARAVEEGRDEAKAHTTISSLVAQGAVGGTLAIVHSRLLEQDARPLVELVSPLMSMIVTPYLGTAQAQRELDQPTLPLVAHPPARPAANNTPTDPFEGLRVRFTYRTAMVLDVIASEPGASNRRIGDASGTPDRGQISKLLKRLQHAGLVTNNGAGPRTGEPNAWTLTNRGKAIHTALAGESDALG